MPIDPALSKVYDDYQALLAKRDAVNAQLTDYTRRVTDNCILYLGKVVDSAQEAKYFTLLAEQTRIVQAVERAKQQALLVNELIKIEKALNL